MSAGNFTGVFGHFLHQRCRLERRLLVSLSARGLGKRRPRLDCERGGLLYQNGKLYAGGPFTNSAGHPPPPTPLSGTARAGPPGATPIARSGISSPNGSNIYVGGEFTSIGGVSANRIVKWDGINYSPLGVGRPGLWRRRESRHL